MRSRFIPVILLLTALLACGCMEAPSPAPAATPAPLPASIPPSPTAAGPKEINLTAWQGEHDVVLRYNGGRDAASLTVLKVQIDNRDGRNVKTNLYSPEIGKEYRFPYIGVVNPNTINVIGVFDDGTEQTVMMKYF
jgi:hypothetical protein